MKKAWTYPDRGPTVRFCEPWSVHTVQTVALFQALKQRRSISFFPPYTASFRAYSLNKFNPETKPSPHSPKHFLPLPHSLNHSLVSAFLPHRHRNSAQMAAHSLNYSLPLSHAHLCLSPSSLSQLTLCLVTVTIIWYFIRFNSSFFYVNLYFFVQFLKEIKFIFLTKTIIKREREKKSNPCFLCIIVC